MNKIIKLLNDEIESARKELNRAKKDCSQFGMYDDCGDYYHENVAAAKARVSALIVVRGKIKKCIGLEEEEEKIKNE